MKTSIASLFCAVSLFLAVAVNSFAGDLEDQLSVAVMDGNVNIIKFLLKRGANINSFE